MEFLKNLLNLSRVGITRACLIEGMTISFACYVERSRDICACHVERSRDICRQISPLASLGRYDIIVLGRYDSEVFCLYGRGVVNVRDYC